MPGSTVAALFVAMSVTPSLLPRTWLVQGVISGLSAATGYAAGAAGGSLAHLVLRARTRDRLRTRASLVVAAAVGPLLAMAVYQSTMWQHDIHRLMGEPPPTRNAYFGVLLVTGLILAGAIVLGRGVRALARVATRLLRRWLPARAAWLTAVGMVTLLCVALVNGVINDGFVGAAASSAESLNRADAAVTPPTSAVRSGGPGSLMSWSSLGLQGRAFVAGGPTLDDLRGFSGRPPVEPVRVFVGLDSTSAITDAAALGVRELRRTGGFERRVLVVATVTGTGWIDPYAAAALEYMYNGNTAIVAIQYSYLPSWISFLTEPKKVEQAGRELFNRVHAEWSTLPLNLRPTLLVFGESLGSRGSEAAFHDIDDLRLRVDGALWAGPTTANPLWRRLVAGRDGGTTQVRPTFQDGVTVRFSDFGRTSSNWTRPRVLYLQHASDPVTWWSPALILHKPDWLREPPAADVLPAMRWYPFVTFWQVAGDLALAANAPPGPGHNYRREIVAGWAAIAPPTGWGDADTARLIKVLDAPRLRATT